MTSTDKLKETAELLGRTIKKSNVIGSGLTFDLKDYKGFKVKFYSYPMTIKIDIKAESAMTVSFHQPDSICLIKEPLPIEYPTRVFTSSMDNKQDVIEFANTVRTMIEGLNLEHSESLVIYKNQISADINPDRDIISTVNRLIEIIKHNKRRTLDKEKVNDLPDNLKDLYFMFDKYSISDDLERDELVEMLTTKEIKTLIDKVDHRTGDIVDYLNSFGDKPLTENAQLLMSLFELVAELKNAPQQQL
jgi:hypothetical protein